MDGKNMKIQSDNYLNKLVQEIIQMKYSSALLEKYIRNQQFQDDFEFNVSNYQMQKSLNSSEIQKSINLKAENAENVFVYKNNNKCIKNKENQNKSLENFQKSIIQSNKLKKVSNIMNNMSHFVTLLKTENQLQKYETDCNKEDLKQMYSHKNQNDNKNDNSIDLSMNEQNLYSKPQQSSSSQFDEEEEMDLVEIQPNQNENDDIDVDEDYIDDILAQNKYFRNSVQKIRNSTFIGLQQDQQALKIALNCMEIIERFNDQQISMECNYILGCLYYKVGQINESVFYFLKISKQYQPDQVQKLGVKMSETICQSLEKLAYLYIEQIQYLEADEMFKNREFLLKED
ncbi:hypothetical protein PPERSA_12936 [Pseudocohnilembus persalinus]|uniref:Tetratricopeptide repeat protein n=1 Tax=Pseudocohnilembus persalinus TaxID=266149 RepID=A0A0V0R1N6_PSEPJ|nr:hypothetical protein PPERSA_12936 [Pseudocohnilembus persalinus]|eukprot:KRX08455.1 hypothetical protein PPERSA_12936 [Pseudocohnilembus persalinus]